MKEMNKTCSYCKQTLPLEAFHRHPTASYGRKNICKACSSHYGKDSYDRRIAALGKKRQQRVGGIVLESNHKRGDTRSDGCVFYSKRKLKDGRFQEWWLTKEKFDKVCKSQRQRVNWRYHNDPAFRKQAVRKNTSEKAKARKRSWNNRNRAYLDEYLSNRRAKQSGAYAVLSDDQKRRVRDIYAIKRILNKVHGKVMFHVDHIKPISRGGLHHPDNLQLATAEYNVKKFVNDKPKEATDES